MCLVELQTTAPCCLYHRALAIPAEPHSRYLRAVTSVVSEIARSYAAPPPPPARLVPLIALDDNGMGWLPG